MSDFRAIAGVSATLRALLRDRMELPAGMAAVPPISIGTPLVPTPQTPEDFQPEPARINLFLFQVKESPYLKNQDLPGRGLSLAYGKPPLSLELHFLLTAYGSQLIGETATDETTAQLLLGSAMRVLHDYPVITSQIQTVREPYGRRILHESLQRADEQVKLCLDPITLEDLTKIWTALTLPYRLSVAYSVSVVRIESQGSRHYPQLVGEGPEAGLGIVAVPLDRPAIESLNVIRLGEPTEHTTPYARVGDTLVIVGRNFGRATEVEINGLRIPVSPESGTRIEVTVPDTAIQGTTIPVEKRLQPGAQPVEVLSRIAHVENFRLRSNRANFMLVPLISAINTTPPRTLRIVGQRLYQIDGNMQTLVGYALFNGDAYDEASPTGIGITLPDVLPLRSTAAFVGAPITQLNDIDSTPEFMISINNNGPHVLTFSSQPTTREEAAIELENRLRGVAAEAMIYKGARVTLLDNRLVIVPGGGAGTVAVQSSGTNNAAAVLGLTTGANRVGYLSGRLAPMPTLTSSTPEIRVEMDSRTFDAGIGPLGGSVKDAAGALQAALQAGPTPAFTGTRVIPVKAQLLILTGGDSPIVFDAGPADDTTVGELHLRRKYAVRVRVNGAESIGGVGSVELPL
ncbi:MAG: DUF4255 domain-containing protein [Desulfococcus multivorans]|jgi:hypothetical protein|nr:DUF4255 domain-containing protein [Desulfococcus multivorans]